MSTDQWKLARSIAEAALDLVGDDRCRLIKDRCGEDEELESAVRILVGDDESNSTFLTPPDPGRVKSSFSGALFRDRIGAYRIRGVLGRGGMGTVFEAERDNPRRTVALKMMNPGSSSSSSIRRFRLETEVLAKLRHPGIAQIYEVGALEEPSADPVLYFVMEYVDDASNLIDFAKKKNLSPEDRIRLFLRVCGAVQYGHEKGVIHRDIKPGNILVNGAGDPKLIDYGVARMRNAEPSLRTTDEERAHIVGTLLYMSPEQLSGDTSDVDVRTDVYALGVCLFELLLDRTPHRFRSDSIPEALRTLTRDPPSAPRSINPDLPVELEWILLKILSHDPAKRYASALDVASDLKRFLAFEPVEAGPETRWYRLRKLVRRNRVVVGSGVFILLSMVILLVVISLNLAREKELRKTANTEKERAIREERRVQFVSDFLLDMFSRVTPSQEEGVDVLMVEVLDEAAALVEVELKEDSELEFRVREALVHAYTNILKFHRAEPQIRRCLELLNERESVPDGQVHDLMLTLVANYRHQGSFEAAASLGRKALDRALPDSVAAIEARAQLAFVSLDQGNLEVAEAELHEVLSWYREHSHPSSSELVIAVKNMVALKLALGKLEECEEMARYAVEATRSLFGSESWRTASSLNTLGSVLKRKGNYEEAETLYEQALRLREASFGGHHYLTLISQNNLASLLMEKANEKKNLPEAERLLLDLARRLSERETVDPGLLAGLSNLGWLLLDQSRVEEGVAVFRDLVLISEKARERYWRQGFFLRGYGVALLRNGQPEEAEAQFLKGYEIVSGILGPDNRHSRRIAGSLTSLYRSTGKPKSAEIWAAKM